MQRILQTTLTIPQSGERQVLLYGIDVKHLLHQYSSQKGQGVAFEWNIRLDNSSSPSSTSSFSSSSSSSSNQPVIAQDSRLSSTSSSSYVSDYDINSDPPGRHQNLNLYTGNMNKISKSNKNILIESNKYSKKLNKYSTCSTLHYEIRTLTPLGSTLVSQGLISLSPSPTCVGYSEGGWVRCRGLIQCGDIPEMGKIEIWLVDLNINDGLVAVDVSQLEASNISTRAILSPATTAIATVHSTNTDDGMKGTNVRDKMKSNNDHNNGINYNNDNDSEITSKNNFFLNDVIFQTGGDYNGWSNEYNRICSLLPLSSSSMNNGINDNDYHNFIPKNFSISRRILYLENRKFNENKKCKITFQAKLKSLKRQNNKNDDKNRNEKLNKSDNNKDENSEKMKDGWGYRWCVVVMSGVGVARGTAMKGTKAVILSEGEYRHVHSNEREGKESNDKNSNNNNNNDDNNNNNNNYNNNGAINLNGDNSEKMENEGRNAKNGENKVQHVSQLSPWIWMDISADLGPLHSGSEIFLCTFPVLTNNEMQIGNNVCTVDVQNFNIFHTISNIGNYVNIDNTEYRRNGNENENGNENRNKNGNENENENRNRNRNSRVEETYGHQLEAFKNESSHLFMTAPRIGTSVHYALHNDQSLLLPYF